MGGVAVAARRRALPFLTILLLAAFLLVMDSKAVTPWIPSSMSSSSAISASDSSWETEEAATNTASVTSSLRGTEIVIPTSDNSDQASHQQSSVVTKTRITTEAQNDEHIGLVETANSQTQRVIDTQEGIVVSVGEDVATELQHGTERDRTKAVVEDDTVGSISKDSIFSACMLTMDDNHFLLEWLPYHYHALPLRDFIIAVDPNGHTSPSKIFDRWRRHGMMIEEWTDRDFMPPDVYDKSLWLNLTEQDRVDMHRQRQNHFQATCVKKLKARNRTWTLMIDSDEYLRLNLRKANSEKIPLPSMGDSGAIMQFLQQQDPPAPPCIMVPRMRVGTIESSPKANRTLPSWVNRSSFQTLRFRRHFARHDINMHKSSKNILDVSRINVEDMVVDNPHRTIKAVCPRKGLWTKVDESFYVVHHYLGTWEQFSSRNDARQGPGRSHHPGTYDMYKVANAPDSDDDSIQPWLEGFVNSTGSAKAESLLRGVGVVGYDDNNSKR